MTAFTGPPREAIRNKPITPELKQVLHTAANAAGIDAIRITSGGQDALGRGTRRTGSTRHDNGRAADLQCVVAGTTLSFTDRSAPEAIITFVSAAAAAGATGIGAGVGYMGNRTIHVGFGTSANDHARLTWGAGGRAVNAPDWLRESAEAGWESMAPVEPMITPGVGPLGRYAVIARNGLKLRGGPGTNYTSQATLPAGTELDVIAIDPVDPAWVKVDLQGDGLFDGYLFAAFLSAVVTGESNENAPEPDGGSDA